MTHFFWKERPLIWKVVNRECVFQRNRVNYYFIQDTIFSIYNFSCQGPLLPKKVGQLSLHQKHHILYYQPFLPKSPSSKPRGPNVLISKTPSSLLPFIAAHVLFFQTKRANSLVIQETIFYITNSCCLGPHLPTRRSYSNSIKDTFSISNSFCLCRLLTNK